MGIGAFLAKRSRSFWIFLGVALVIILGIIDYLTGYEINISIFYLIPIFLAIWYTDGQMGLILSFASTIAGSIANYFSGLSYSHPSIYVWDALLRIGFYLVVTWLSTALKKAYRANQELARTDYVTGAVSIRYFYELVQTEMGRSQRYHRPFALAYIDVDDFKNINDHFGHSTGDKVLRAVVYNIRNQVRPTDILARLGGDEFALLLPETGEEAAKTVMNRLHSNLNNEMSGNGWKVTFSIGVVICNESPQTVDEVVNLADDVMYKVKNAGKNGVNYCTCTN